MNPNPTHPEPVDPLDAAPAYSLPTQQTPGLVAMNERRFRVPGDTVNRATADLPDDQRSLVRWLHAHAAENDMPLAEVGKLIHYDETNIHKLFHGRYSGSLVNVCREIKAFKNIHDERTKSRAVQFIRTRLSTKIYQVCDASREFSRISFVFSSSQIGKSATLLQYTADNNHGSTIYISIPTGGGYISFLTALSKRLRISENLKVPDMERRIIESFDDRMLLIVDEAHQCCRTKNENVAVRPIEFVRELFDAKKCGVVICGTNIFRTAMDDGGNFSAILKQTKLRRLFVLQLPATPPPDDMNTFAAAFSLPPAQGSARKLQDAIIREEALGYWLTLLRMSRKLAINEKRKLTWDHVEQAYAGLQTMESPNQ